MSQTALNLTAISIFVVTLSTLLGPLFNLSPTADLLVGGGLFIIGALTQVVMMQMQKGGDEEL